MAVRARALLRSNVGATLALLVLAGLAAGFALGAWGASRRGGGAFDRFLDHARQAELSVFVCAPTRPQVEPRAPATTQLARLRALPVVEAAARTAAVPVRYEIPGVGNLDAAIEVIIDDEFPTPEGHPSWWRGACSTPRPTTRSSSLRAPTPDWPAGTVFAITPLKARGVELGDADHRAPSRAAGGGQGSPAVEPGGPDRRARAGAGGTRRSARAGGSAMAPWSATTASSSRSGRCPAPTRRSSGPRSPRPWARGSMGSEPAIGDEQLSVASAIRYEAAALGLFAAAVAVAALVFVGQALARQASREASDTETLRAIGMSARPARRRRCAPCPAGRAWAPPPWLRSGRGCRRPSRRSASRRAPRSRAVSGSTAPCSSSAGWRSWPGSRLASSSRPSSRPAGAERRADGRGAWGWSRRRPVCRSPPWPAPASCCRPIARPTCRCGPRRWGWRWPWAPR